MNNLELTSALITSPSAAFADLKAKPRFLFPLLVVVASTAAIFFWYYSIVDFPWLMDRIMSANPRMNEMSEDQREQALKFMSPTFVMWSSVISAAVFTAATRVLGTVYFMIAGNIVNVRHKFEQWFALTCWASLPHVIGIIVMAVYLLTASTNQIGNEDLSLLSLNSLFFDVPMSGKGFTLLSTLTLIHPWVWWLTVVGVRTWTGRSWLFSSVFALAPMAVVYGGWAAWSFSR